MLDKMNVDHQEYDIKHNYALMDTFSPPETHSGGSTSALEALLEEGSYYGLGDGRKTSYKALQEIAGKTKNKLSKDYTSSLINYGKYVNV